MATNKKATSKWEVVSRGEVFQRPIRSVRTVKVGEGETAVTKFIINEEFDEDLIDDLLNEFENPAKILDTNWYAIKPMYEKKYRELISDKDKFVSINDIRLSRDCVKKAIKYLREIYRHRIGKTKVISLNNHTGKTF